jgi:two-component system sensor histidine kinase PilS (NtrC family)
MSTAAPNISDAAAASAPPAGAGRRGSAIGEFSAPAGETHWRSLFYFNVYRLLLAMVLLIGTQVPIESLGKALTWGSQRPLIVGLLVAYCAACGASLIAVWRIRRSFNVQLTLQVIADILVFAALIFLGGGLRSGFGIMLLVTLAGAGLVGQGRLTLFYAALATIAVLGQEVLSGLVGQAEPSDFFLAGVLSLGFFGTAGSARLLARRLLANEELARRRGIALRRQMQVNEKVIALVQDGVLVATASGHVQQANPRARELIGAAAAGIDSVEQISPVLAAAYSSWLAGGGDVPCDFRARGSGRQLQAHFVRVEGEGDDSLIFLEDAGQALAEAQKVKLAALGRLTASIAHEIRNPLSAIRHANELLGETRGGEGDQRLIRIVADNTRRLDSIVSDILQLGRRDRTQREAIDLAAYVAGFADQFAHQSGVARAVIRTAIEPGHVLQFDRSHLHQILWNLAGNALRHSRQVDGSVRVWSESGPGWCALHVADDGAGIADAQRASIFEPFYTTHAKGTGLGLFIARELAEANGARLELMENAPGGHFSIVGDGSA